VNTHTKAKTSKKILRIIENAGQIGACTDLRDIFWRAFKWVSHEQEFWGALSIHIAELECFSFTVTWTCCFSTWV